MKRIFKKTIPNLPFYHSLCLVLRRHKWKNSEWIYRIPVKPEILVPVYSGVGNFHMSHPERDGIAKKFFWTQGVLEPIEERIMLNLFAYLSKYSNGILDIGSNSGLFTLVAAKSNPNAEIIAFDILPEANRILIDNLMLNNLLENVEVQLVGIGKKEGAFYVPLNDITSQMPTSVSLDCKLKYSHQIQVPIKTLDEICIPRFIGKKLTIKIDVESTEIDIFVFGRETLSKIKPDIICEVLPGARQTYLYDQILKDYSYWKYLITDEGLKKFDKIEPNKRYKDWFFTARENFNIEITELLK